MARKRRLDIHTESNQNDPLVLLKENWNPQENASSGKNEETPAIPTEIQQLFSQKIRDLPTIKAQLEDNYTEFSGISLFLEPVEFLKLLHHVTPSPPVIFCNLRSNTQFFFALESCFYFLTSESTEFETWKEYLDFLVLKLAGHFKDEEIYLKAKRLGITTQEEYIAFKQILNEELKQIIAIPALKEAYFTPEEKYEEKAYPLYLAWKNSPYKKLADFLITKLCTIQDPQEYISFRQSDLFDYATLPQCYENFQEFQTSEFQNPTAWKQAQAWGVSTKEEYAELLNQQKLKKIIIESLREANSARKQNLYEIFIQKLYLAVEKWAELLYWQREHQPVENPVEFNQLEDLYAHNTENQEEFPPEGEMKWLRAKRNKIIHENAKCTIEETRRALNLYRHLESLIQFDQEYLDLLESKQIDMPSNIRVQIAKIRIKIAYLEKKIDTEDLELREKNSIVDQIDKLKRSIQELIIHSRR